MSDIAEKGTPLYELRVALRRLLIEFQADLDGLEEKGLVAQECEEVQRLLRETIQSFEDRASGPTSVYTVLAKHFRKYAELYIEWNGHEGSDPAMYMLRRSALAKLTKKRKTLFRKLSSRQAELAQPGQLDLPFAKSIQESLVSVAKIHAEKFPRMAQARLMFNFR